ncbi:hypothetical protein BOC57_23790 [Burkholderia pseudomallei]|nr:hypothetical protein BOC57_23790 [Burkholderia pseudomallei]
MGSDMLFIPLVAIHHSVSRSLDKEFSSQRQEPGGGRTAGNPSHHATRGPRRPGSAAARS